MTRTRTLCGFKGTESLAQDRTPRKRALDAVPRAEVQSIRIIKHPNFIVAISKFESSRFLEFLYTLLAFLRPVKIRYTHRTVITIVDRMGFHLASGRRRTRIRFSFVAFTV